jgi:Bifunctional DNA primase/polymerase, N-terminal
MSLNTLPIFPCKLDKSPLTPNGFYNAIVGADYSGWPRVGVATGTVSGIDVIDIDPDGLVWLDANRQRLPLTREHQTSRGVHLLLKHHPGMRNSNRRIAPGVDVRGDGGYFIYWPREGFPVIDRPLAPWPEWLLALTTVDAHSDVQSVEGRMCRSPSHANAEIERTGSVKLRSRYILNKVERAKPGERNRLLFWGSCRHGEMIAEGRIKREIAERLLEGAAKTNGLWRDGAGDVRATIRSGTETGIKRWQAMDKATMQGAHTHMRPSSVGTGSRSRAKT